MIELKTGDQVKSKAGNVYVVQVVRNPRRDTGYDEPMYRLVNGIVGRREWTLEELYEAGITVIKGA